MNSLQEFLATLVEQGEPSMEGTWYVVERDSFPFSLLQFHFNDEGALTGVKITNYNDEPIAEYYVNTAENE